MSSSSKQLDADDGRLNQNTSMSADTGKKKNIHFENTPIHIN